MYLNVFTSQTVILLTQILQNKNYFRVRTVVFAFIKRTDSCKSVPHIKQRTQCFIRVA